jgi:hypothetical protein
MSGGRSVILTYHSLDDSESVISTPPSLFRQQMEFLAASGIPVAPLDQALHCPGELRISIRQEGDKPEAASLPLIRFMISTHAILISQCPPSLIKRRSRVSPQFRQSG